MSPAPPSRGHSGDLDMAVIINKLLALKQIYVNFFKTTFFSSTKISQLAGWISQFSKKITTLCDKQFILMPA